MKCPTRKDIIDYLSADSSSTEDLERHLDACPACQAVAEEERHLDCLVREGHDSFDVSPYLWTRIESRLDEPRPVSAPLWGWSFLARWTQLVMVAGAAVVLVAAGLIFLQPSNPPTGILASIDTGYHQVMTQIPSLEKNPFDGRKMEFHAVREENPFRPAETRDDDTYFKNNPFKTPIIDTGKHSGR